MTIHQLKILECVAKHLSVTRAARALHISQPSVSKQLRLLEEECGAQFHARNGRAIKITDQGHQFLDAARPVLQHVEQLRTFFQAAEQKPGSLNIGATQSACVSFLPEVLKAFRHTQPGAQYTLLTAHSQILEDLLLHSQIEIALLTHPSYNPNLIVELIHSQEATAVVSPKHPFAPKRKLTDEQLRNSPVILRREGRVWKNLKKLGVKLNNIVVECDSVEAAKAAVKSGLGLGFFYRDTVASELREGSLRLLRIPVLKRIKVNCFIVYQKERVLSPFANSFVKLLRESAPQFP